MSSFYYGVPSSLLLFYWPAYPSDEILLRIYNFRIHDLMKLKNSFYCCCGEATKVFYANPVTPHPHPIPMVYGMEQEVWVDKEVWLDQGVWLGQGV